MLNELISIFLQLAVFTLIPFISYRFFYKQKNGFLNYIGLKKTPLKPVLLALALALPLTGLMIVFILNSPEMLEAMKNPKSMTGKFHTMGPGFNTLILIFFSSVIKTALSEEILFRGFIAKRLIAIMGFIYGNLSQAFIFAIIHTLIFLTITDSIIFLVSIFFMPFTVALFSAWLNEKKASGSIIPGWVAHASGNFITYLFFTIY